MCPCLHLLQYYHPHINFVSKMASVWNILKASSGVHFLTASSMVKSCICLRFLDYNHYSNSTRWYKRWSSVLCNFLFSNHFCPLSSNYYIPETLLLFHRQENNRASCFGQLCLLCWPWLNRYRQCKLVTCEKQKRRMAEKMKWKLEKTFCIKYVDTMLC